MPILFTGVCCVCVYDQKWNPLIDVVFKRQTDRPTDRQAEERGKHWVNEIEQGAEETEKDGKIVWVSEWVSERLNVWSGMNTTRIAAISMSVFDWLQLHMLSEKRIHSNGVSERDASLATETEQQRLRCMWSFRLSKTPITDNRNILMLYSFFSVDSKKLFSVEIILSNEWDTVVQLFSFYVDSLHSMCVI